MSDTAEMVRLIRHAAKLLDEQDTVSLLPSNMSREEEQRCVPALQATVSAMSLASGVLRMVAACMEPESEPHVRAVNQVRALLAIAEGVYVRADEVAEALAVAS